MTSDKIGYRELSRVISKELLRNHSSRERKILLEAKQLTEDAIANRKEVDYDNLG